MFHTPHYAAPIGDLTTVKNPYQNIGDIIVVTDNDNGGYKRLKYVKIQDLSGSVTVRDGSAVMYCDVSGVQSKTTVSPDISGGTAAASLQAAGVVMAANESGAVGSASVTAVYGWILIEGYHANVLTGGSVSVDDPVACGGADGKVATQSGTYAATHPLRFIGTALATDAGSPTTSPCYVNVLMKH